MDAGLAAVLGLIVGAAIALTAFYLFHHLYNR